jgi:hypothetical protein
MGTIPTENELYNLLEYLKQVQVLSVREMNGDAIYLAERLVDLRLASKLSTRINTFYFYGVSKELRHVVAN